MDYQLQLRKMISDEMRRNQKLYNRMAKRLEKLPQGSLVKRRNRNYCVTREAGKQKFTPIAGKKPVQELKLRRYTKLALPLIEARISACREFLRLEKTYDPYRLEKKLGKQYHDLKDMDIFLDNDINLDEWRGASYERNGKKINIPHFTAKGIMVRSKSEELIGNSLENAGFSFRYEPALELGNQRVSPDFEILLSRRRRVVYWEHLGLVDNPDYVMSNLNKLELYANHGIYLGYNLIITYETLDIPLTSLTVNEKIEELRRMNRA